MLDFIVLVIYLVCSYYYYDYYYLCGNSTCACVLVSTEQGG